MQEFNTTADAIEWLKAEEKRVLVIGASHLEFNHNYFLNEFTTWANSKTTYEFAVIDEINFSDDITYHQYENRYILGMGAPYPLDFLNTLLPE